MHNTFDKLTKERDKLNIILGDQIGTYNKAEFDYQSKTNTKYFRKFVAQIQSLIIQRLNNFNMVNMVTILLPVI